MISAQNSPIESLNSVLANYDFDNFDKTDLLLWKRSKHKVTYRSYWMHTDNKILWVKFIISKIKRVTHWGIVYTDLRTYIQAPLN